MRWLAFPHLSHPSSKSIYVAIAAAAGFTPTSRISSSLIRRRIFVSCPSNPLNFDAFRVRLRYCSDFNKKSLAYSLSYSNQMASETSDESVPSSPTVIRLKSIEATPESFQEFGQVIEASPDGDEFGPRDAQLDLSQGIPRFYIMHIEDRPLEFSTITHHANVTQCLGSIGGHTWYLGVAKPSIVDPSETEGKTGADMVKSHAGHFYVPPAVEYVRVFRISGPKFVKLNRGTWHAGPLFLEKKMDFYNLELSNTNVVDHTMHNFVKKNNVIFSFDE